ncbi:MAG: amidohydrolase family protein [Bryobacteraceae bacterium]|nr:amidohydrolase family protein [Bryobacteraceae bacterium]MDW8380350.1 amidohydrolase family protein [Bryobacterales bacterium]
MIIDAHHHFWRYTPAEYNWIGPHMGILRRDYLPADLKREMDQAGVSQAISVQARQSIEETRFLLTVAGQHDFLAGVVGWLPLTDPGFEKLLESFLSERKFKGLRHVIQDEGDDFFILREDFNRGVAALRNRVVYDILIFERHLPQTIQFVDRHPDQVFVLDHLAKPRIRDGLLSPWRERLRELARRPQVYCKISGMATEANWNRWTPAELKPYFDIALEAFGPKRLMFGSDWPVLRLAGEYGAWVDTVRGWIGKLSAAEQRWILEGTAREAYRL